MRATMSMPKRRNSFCTAANRGCVAASCATAIMMPMFCLNMFQYPVTTEVKNALSSGESGSRTLNPEGVDDVMQEGLGQRGEQVLLVGEVAVEHRG